jgi:hypothetical protein
MRAKSTLLLAVVQVACLRTATEYRPVGVAAGDSITPSYELPSAAPKGTLRVVTFGGERLPVGPGAPEVYLHLRLVAENDSDASAWVLDPNEQLLTFNGQTLPPSYSRASGAGPVLSLERGERGFLDVYFPLPELDPARVSLAWRLRRGGEVLAELTSFDRVSGRTDDYFDYDTGASFGMGLGWFWPEYCWRWHGGYLAPYVARHGDHPSSRRTWVPPAGESSSGGSGSASHSSESSSSSSASDSSSSASAAAPPSSSSSSSGDEAKSAWRGGGHH